MILFHKKTSIFKTSTLKTQLSQLQCWEVKVPYFFRIRNWCFLLLFGCKSLGLRHYYNVAAQLSLAPVNYSCANGLAVPTRRAP